MANIEKTIPSPPPMPRKTSFLPGNQNPPRETKGEDSLAEFQLSCHLGGINFNQPLKCQYYDVTPILQEGPTCGITALSMLLGGTPDVQTLLTTAKTQKMTNYGEMFSVRNLFQLACEHLSTLAKNAENALPQCEVHEGQLNCAKVKEILIAGGALLVPYPFSTRISV